MSNFRHIITFIKAWIKNPRAMGSITPSSTYLAAYITAQIHQTKEGKILELGPGTGAITQAILKSRIDSENIILLERDTQLAQKLKTQFPAIQVINDDASKLSEIFSEQDPKIDTIISSLPIVLLDKATRDAIFSQIPKILSKNGRLIQFTYNLKQNNKLLPSNYKLLHSKLIWRNLPPARVYVFETC